MNHFTNDQRMGSSETTTLRRVHYGRWFLKLVAWDGVLPVVVLLAPTVVEQQFPNRREAMEVMAMILPITAFFVRFFVAKRHINSNQCTHLVRCFQIIALCLAILVLLLIDSLIILAHEMPKGALFATTADRIAWVVLSSVYLTTMAFAMYPGRTSELRPVEWRDFVPPADYGRGVGNS